jgi:hypothetical protein
MRNCLAITVFLLLLFRASLSGCPRNCNGRGVCGEDGQCICEEPFNAAPDCSLSENSSMNSIIFLI